MKLLWKIIGLMPESFLGIIKRHSSSDLRFKIREKLGASYNNIPKKIASVPDGRKFQIGPDPMYWAIYHGIDYEPEATQLAKSLLQETDTVLDIGANFGWFSTAFAKKTGSIGRVIAFEPVPNTYQHLIENLRLNSLESAVSTHNIALGNTTGTIDIHVFSDKGHGFSSISSLGESDFELIKTKITKLDDFIQEHDIQRVNFIKCDVEGAELSVLQGGTKLLQSDKPPILLIELNDETSQACGYSAKDIWQLLTSLGYDGFYSIVNGNKIRKINEVSEFQSLSSIGQISKTVVPHLAICAKEELLMERVANSAVEIG